MESHDSRLTLKNIESLKVERVKQIVNKMDCEVNYVNFNKNVQYDDSLAITTLITPSSSRLKLLITLYSLTYYRTASYGIVYNTMFHLMIFGCSKSIIEAFNNLSFLLR